MAHNIPRMKRRAFLKAGVALPALGAGLGQPDDRAAPHSSFDPWVDVHAGHLRANAAAVRKHARVPILAVIKNNGYGAGVVHVARALEPLNEIRGFAVVKLHEAMALRDAGIRKPVLLMGPAGDQDVVEIVRRDIDLMVYTPIAGMLERAAVRAGRTARVHVCVDTGLGRVGVPSTPG